MTRADVGIRSYIRTYTPIRSEYYEYRFFGT